MSTCPLTICMTGATSAIWALLRAKEKRLLASALIAPDRRDAISSALFQCEKPSDASLPEDWNVAAMRKLRSRLKADRTAPALDLPVVIDAIITFEQLHEAVLAVFNTLLWWGTENPHTLEHEFIYRQRF